MTELTVFENPEFGTIRTVELDGEPWLVGKDVATALGYSNTKDALAKHVDPEDKRQDDGVAICDPMGREQHPTIINESGLYSLVLSSKLPTARKFRRWVTSEVLPSIRRTGGYTAKPEPAPRDRVMALNARTRAANLMTRLWNAAGVRPADQALALNGYFDGLSLPREAFGEVCTHTLDATAIADHLGVLSASGKPHNQAVAALIGELELDESEQTLTPYSRNGHDGASTQYTPSVEDKVRAWLDSHGWPSPLPAGGKKYAVKYRKCFYPHCHGGQ